MTLNDAVHAFTHATHAPLPPAVRLPRASGW